MAMPLCLRALRLLRAAPVRRLHTAPRAESTVPISISHSAPPKHDDHDDINVYDKNPDWHGFSDDAEQDVRHMRLLLFFGFSLCLVVLPLYVVYAPGRRLREWAHREAERQIKRKQALGLPLIEMNYYDPETLVLPPEDE